MSILIGIDPGTHTGVALAIGGELKEVYTATIIEAQENIRHLKERGHTFTLLIEDPRNQRVAPSQYNSARLKGVGSVTRDFRIWTEFAEHHGIRYRTTKPGKYRRIDAATFKRMTGWQKRTNEHNRAAAMMVWGRTN